MTYEFLLILNQTVLELLCAEDFSTILREGDNTYNIFMLLKSYQFMICICLLFNSLKIRTFNRKRIFNSRICIPSSIQVRFYTFG